MGSLYSDSNRKSSVTSPKFKAVIRLYGQPFGRSDDGALQTGKLPDSPDSLAMMVSFTLLDTAPSTRESSFAVNTEPTPSDSAKTKSTKT